MRRIEWPQELQFEHRLLILVGLQLVISWILLRVLDEINGRDSLAEKDLGLSSWRIDG